jgi:serine/threonine protein kinase
MIDEDGDTEPLVPFPEVARIPTRYVPLQSRGVGRLTEVWEAADTLLGRRVAVHLLAERWGDERTVNELFVDWAKSTARLPLHPNLAVTFDAAGASESPCGVPYMVTEAYTRSLLELLVESPPRPLTPYAAYSILRDVALAIDALHAAGLVHGDLTPRCVFVIAGGERSVVSDVGLTDTMIYGGPEAFSLERLTNTVYVSPQVRRGGYPTAEDDVYSYAALARRVLGAQAASGRAKRALERGLHRNPRRRPHSAMELLQTVWKETRGVRKDAVVEAF